MSKVIALAGGTAATNVVVKQKTGKLNFVYTTPVANTATVALMLARLNLTTLKVELQSSGGANNQLDTDINLGVIAEIFSCLEGVIDVQTVGANSVIKFSREISYNGAVRFDNDTNIIINTNAIPAADTMDVYATDFPIEDRSMIKTNVLRFSANAPQGIGLANGNMLALPVASFTQIELFYPGSQSVTLLKEELAEWCLEGNEEVVNNAGVMTYGNADYFVINTVDAVSAKVTQSADVNGYLLTQISL